MSEALMGETRAPNASAPAAKLGAELRAARLALGWELADLARSLRIRQAYLEAIEAGRIGDLPGSTYALGFVRAYASALGLQGEQVASRFRAEASEANVRPALSFPAPVPQRGVPAGALMLLGLVVLAGTYSGWYYFSARQHTPIETVPPIPDHLLSQTVDRPTPSPQVASILPSAAPPAPAPTPPAAQTVAPASQTQTTSPATAATANAAAVKPAAPPPPANAMQATQQTPPTVQGPPPAPAQPAALQPPVQTAAAPPPPAPTLPPGTRLVVKATADAWVTIKQKAGPTLFSKLMHAGDTWPVPADKKDLLMTTGNAGGTEIDVDGTPVQGLGGNGLVRHDLPLDADALKSGHLPPIGRPKPKPAPASEG